MALPRIFASGVYGSDFDVWGAWSFSNPGTRNKLGRIITPNDFCLSIGMMGPDTPEEERGRLLALIRIGPEQIMTADLVHPRKWRESLATYGERWMYGFPIRAVERFDDRPLRSEILPRIARENLYRVVGKHFVELTPAEARRVLALPRTPDPNIYTTGISAFASRLLKQGRGPKPAQKTRTLSPSSGPAATYCLELRGSLAHAIHKSLQLEDETKIIKIGFSRDPDRRAREINCYLPSDEALRWESMKVQWHEDEINAWAMEQRIFDLLRTAGFGPLKGEIVGAPSAQLERSWEKALRSTERPSRNVRVPVLD